MRFQSSGCERGSGRKLRRQTASIQCVRPGRSQQMLDHSRIGTAGTVRPAPGKRPRSSDDDAARFERLRPPRRAPGVGATRRGWRPPRGSVSSRATGAPQSSAPALKSTAAWPPRRRRWAAPHQLCDGEAASIFPVPSRRAWTRVPPVRPKNRAGERLRNARDRYCRPRAEHFRRARRRERPLAALHARGAPARDFEHQDLRKSRVGPESDSARNFGEERGVEPALCCGAA